MKLEIPKFRYLAQEEDGRIYAYTHSPSYGPYDWLIDKGDFIYITEGNKNTDWKNTLIDLEVDDYDYSDGILVRK